MSTGCSTKADVQSPQETTPSSLEIIKTIVEVQVIDDFCLRLLGENELCILHEDCIT